MYARLPVRLEMKCLGIDYTTCSVSGVTNRSQPSPGNTRVVSIYYWHTGLINLVVINTLSLKTRERLRARSTVPRTTVILLSLNTPKQRLPPGPQEITDSPVDELSRASASSGARWVHSAPAERMSLVKRWSGSPSQNEHTRRSTKCQ